MKSVGPPSVDADKYEGSPVFSRSTSSGSPVFSGSTTPGTSPSAGTRSVKAGAVPTSQGHHGTSEEGDLSRTRSTTKTETSPHSSARRVPAERRSRAGPDPGRAQSPVDFGPNVFSSGEELSGEEVDRDTRFLQMWFLCIAFVGTMFIPGILILLGYLSHSGSVSPSSGGTTPILTRSYTSRRTTIKFSAAVDNCSGAVSLTDDINSLSRATTYFSVPPHTKDFQFFCLFNNSRFRKNDNFHYLPEHLPFELCPYVIYWSMSIENGRVQSRVPAFDMQYGIWELKNTSDRLSRRKTKVLMALGGYLEDSPHFSRLGEDSVAMDTLVADIVTMMADFRLDGLAIHWVIPTGTCRPSGVCQILSGLFGRVKMLMSLNKREALMTLFVPYGDTTTVNCVPQNLMDFFFFMTHEFRPDPIPHLSRFCNIIAASALNSLGRAHFFYGSWKKYCVGISMAAFLLEGTNTPSGTDYRYSTSTRFPHIPGRAPLFEECTGHLPPELRSGSCRYYNFSSAASPSSVIYAYLPVATLNDILHISIRAGSSRCTLVADLDFETYKPSCLPLYPTLRKLFLEV